MPVLRGSSCNTLSVPAADARPSSRGSTGSTVARTPSRSSLRPRELKDQAQLCPLSALSAFPRAVKPKDKGDRDKGADRDKGDKGDKEDAFLPHLGSREGSGSERPRPRSAHPALWVRASGIDRQRESDSRRPMSPEQLLSLMVPKKPDRKPDGDSSPSASGSQSPQSFQGSPKLFSRTWSGRHGFHSRRQHRPSTLSVPPKKVRQLEEGQKIFDLYYWEEILQQEGDGGKVVVCRPKSSDEEFKYVMKIKSKQSLREDQHEEGFVRAQTRLLNFPPHPGVIQLQEVLEDNQFYYVVMERAMGGSFFNCLLQEHKDGNMPPTAVCKVARDILETLQHLHSQGILHRDIKPDNMVMHSYDSPTGQKVQKVTLIDFDHAETEFSPHCPTNRAQHCCGTARFNAPEAFMGEYSAATDLYSVGVIVYLLLTGSFPYPAEFFDFPDHSPKSPAANRRWMEQVMSQMGGHQLDWSHSTFEEIPQSKDFCQQLLAFDPSDRLATAEEALQHPWLS